MFAVQNVDIEKLGGKVVNTAGCGDAFVGAFGAYKTLGKTDEESLQYANMAGALKGTRPETRGSPTRRGLENADRRDSRKTFGGISAPPSRETKHSILVWIPPPRA